MSFLDQIARDFKLIIFNGDFSEPVVILDGLGHSASIRGIVDLTHEEVDLSTNTAVMSTRPQVSIWLSDVPFRVKREQEIQLRGVAYLIWDVQEQGDGSAVLILSEDSFEPTDITGDSTMEMQALVKGTQADIRYLIINADGSLVLDSAFTDGKKLSDVTTALAALATSAKQDDAQASIDAVTAALGSIADEKKLSDITAALALLGTSAKQDTINASIGGVSTAIADMADGKTLDDLATVLAAILTASQGANGLMDSDSVSIATADPVTADIALEGMLLQRDGLYRVVIDNRAGTVDVILSPMNQVGAAYMDLLAEADRVTVAAGTIGYQDIRGLLMCDGGALRLTPASAPAEAMTVGWKVYKF